jgi:hypothetical protein
LDIVAAQAQVDWPLLAALDANADRPAVGRDLAEYLDDDRPMAPRLGLAIDRCGIALGHKRHGSNSPDIDISD